jgi:hypothetical protein
MGCNALYSSWQVLIDQLDGTFGTFFQSSGLTPRTPSFRPRN